MPGLETDVEPSEKPTEPTADSFSQVLGSTQQVFDEHIEKAMQPAEVSDELGSDANTVVAESLAQPPVEPSEVLSLPELPSGYTTWGAVEQARTEATQRMNQATQETASVRTLSADLERQNLALRQELLDVRGSTAAEGAEHSDAKSNGATSSPPVDIEDILQKGYDDAARIDPEADDYLDQQAKILAKAQSSAIQQGHQGEALSVEQIQRISDESATKAVQELSKQETQRTQQVEYDRLTAKIAQQATEAGLDVTPPPVAGEAGFAGLHYQDLQTAVDQQMYPAGSTEDQAITHVIQTVKDRHKIVTEPPEDTPADNSAALALAAHQARNQPLQRVSTGPSAATKTAIEDRPMSFTEALSGSMQIRKM